MDFETVIYGKKEQVAVITLNRPKVLNAMNKQLWLDLREAFLAARADHGVRVVVLTGQGRAFSAGADLKDSKDRTLAQ